MIKFLPRFQAISEEDKTEAVTKLIADATPDFDFFFMVVLSVLMATLGLIAGSESVVIGSMLLAPIMSPILELALGLAMSSHKLIRRSLQTFGKAIAFAIGASVVATLLFSFSSFEVTSIILERTAPSLLFFAIAIIAGLAVAYTLVQPHLSATLPGIAVAVALMPPLATVGIGIAHLDVKIAAGATMMFAINVVGIVFASMLAFSLMDVHHKRFIASHTVDKEEERVQAEEAKVEEIIEKNKKEDNNVEIRNE